MHLKDRIQEDMKSAMRAKDSQRLGAIRMLLAAIKQKEIDERRELSETDILAITEKQIKQRRESISQFQAAGRLEAAGLEEFELNVLSAYLPQAASEDEIQSILTQVIIDTGANRPQDMGKVMAVLKVQLAGRADMTQISSLVKAQLSST